MKKVINKNRIFYSIMVLIMLAIIIVTGVKAVFEFVIKDDKDPVSKVKLDSIELYGYTLDDLDSPLYKTYFEELKSVLNEEEVNMESYANGIVKLFVTDFYTLSTKVTSSDIGGVEFVSPEIVDNFKMNAGDTMYNHVKNNVYGDRVQDLPTVKKVTVNSTEELKYTYNEKEYDGYKIEASWEYEVDLGYESKGVFYLIKDNNKISLVEKTGE